MRVRSPNLGLAAWGNGKQIATRRRNETQSRVSHINRHVERGLGYVTLLKNCMCRMTHFSRPVASSSTIEQISVNFRVKVSLIKHKTSKHFPHAYTCTHKTWPKILRRPET